MAIEITMKITAMTETAMIISIDIFNPPRCP